MAESPKDLLAPELPAPDDSGRVGILSRSFLSLVATQFFVSFNDSAYRWLIVPVAKESIPKAWVDMPESVKQWTNPDSLALSLGLACFILPFLLFAAPSGYFADRFSKRNVIAASKAAEVVLIPLGIAAILMGSIYSMFFILFMLGIHSMVFLTARLGAIPEIVHREKISAANGVMNMASTVAIILGVMAGGWLYDMTKPAGQGRWWLHASLLVGVAVLGLISSLLVGRLPAANPLRRIPWNPASQTVRDVRALFSMRPLFLAAFADAYFWTLASILQINIDQFATKQLLVSQTFVGPLLAILALGIAGGALLTGFLSRGKVELGLVPLGGFGIAFTAILLTFAPGGVAGTFDVSSYAVGCLLLLSMGVTAGLYDIPLQAFVQEQSPRKTRGSIMAACNILTFTGILGASGIYWFLSGPLGFSSRGVFLVCGLVTLPIAIVILRLVPSQTAGFLSWVLGGCICRVKPADLQDAPKEDAQEDA